MRTSRRELLVSLAAGSLVGLRAAAGEPRKRLIVVVAAGAWDPTFVFDARRGLGDGPFPDEEPEVGAIEVEARFGQIRVSTNAVRRPAVTRFFERWSHRTAVVNGLWTGTLSHWAGLLRILTGGSDPAAPDLVARLGASRGDAALPALDAAGVGRPGTAALTTIRAGVRGQLAALVDPSLRYPLPGGEPRPSPGLVPADDAAIDRFLKARALGDGRVAARAAGAAIRGEAEAIVAATAGRRRGLAEDLRMAADLCAQGLSHAVLVDSGQSWDTHAEAPRQHGCWDETFAALDLLCGRLEEQGALDDTLVLVVSELGRTPWRNAHDGTDHWPYTSAVLIGADVRGGTLLGGTDDGFVGVTCDPSTGRPSAAAPDPLLVTQLTAGVLEAVGLPDALPGVAPLRGFRA